MSDWSGGYRIMSPQDIESKFSVDDGLSYLDFSLDEHMPEESEERLSKVRNILERIPPREADFVELYYFKQKRQTDIAAIFGVSQPTVCYRLQRAAERIRFLLRLPAFDEPTAKPIIQSVLQDPIDVEIMLRMYHTTCQSEVAKVMGVSQGFVRHRFIRSTHRIRSAGHIELADLFDLVGANLNILREVQRPFLDAAITRIIS
ncbi:MAG: sigma-70 family RNA polymerase sigma factor [Actinobacteria bacterium]|nr:sigma-70 family RNA polymerase sigma factor [Actinomycetota bacterium]NBR67950.1 sigma-70 family RNA polymerase sigma factor [Actinomycetota bacterium]